MQCFAPLAEGFAGSKHLGTPALEFVRARSADSSKTLFCKVHWPKWDCNWNVAHAAPRQGIRREQGKGEPDAGEPHQVVAAAPTAKIAERG